VTTDTSTVTAAFTGAGSSLVNNTKAAVAGVATFSGLAITAPIDTTSGVLNFTDASLTSVASGNDVNHWSRDQIGDYDGSFGYCRYRRRTGASASRER